MEGTGEGAVWHDFLEPTLQEALSLPGIAEATHINCYQDVHLRLRMRGWIPRRVHIISAVPTDTFIKIVIYKHFWIQEIFS